MCQFKTTQIFLKLYGGKHEYGIFYTSRVLQVKNIKLLKEKNNPKLQNLLISKFIRSEDLQSFRILKLAIN